MLFPSPLMRPALSVCLRSHTGSNSCDANIPIICKNRKRGGGGRSKVRVQALDLQNIQICMCTYSCVCRRGAGTKGEAQSHDRSTSLAAHPRRCQFYEKYRGLFLDKTQLSPPLLCKVFLLKKCMNGGGDSKCGAHALLTRLHNPSHDSRSQ